MFWRTTLVVFLTVSLLFLTILGALQAAEAGSHNSKCLATILNGSAAPCPAENLLGFINFHLNAFKNFSWGLVNFILSLVAFIILLFVATFPPAAANILPPFSLLRPVSLSSLKQNFHRWLSLHENSPNIFEC